MIDKDDKLPKTFEEALEYPVLEVNSTGEDLEIKILVNINPTRTVNVRVPFPTVGNPVGKLEDVNERGFDNE